MKKLTLIIVTMICIAFGSTRVYEVEPYKNCNGKVSGSANYGVGQIFVATCDSFLRVDFFVGAPNDTGYNIQIIDQSINMPVAEGYAQGGLKIQYQYTRAPLRRTGFGSIIKGKEFLLKITNVNSESINYYYNPDNPYKYGIALVPPQGSQVPIGWDLAVRIEGITRIPQDLFGTEIAMSFSDTGDVASC